MEAETGMSDLTVHPLDILTNTFIGSLMFFALAVGCSIDIDNRTVRKKIFFLAIIVGIKIVQQKYANKNYCKKLFWKLLETNTMLMH